MNDPQAEAQLFLYDLANLATEYWFKPNEGWALTLANDAEKSAFEKQYKPTLYISGEADFLKKTFALMKPSLKLWIELPKLTPKRGGRPLPPAYLLAYNPDRTRK